MPIQSYASIYNLSQRGEVYIQHGVRHVEQFLYLHSVSRGELYGAFIVCLVNRRNDFSGTLYIVKYKHFKLTKTDISG
jgi:hypothetical protein